VPSGAVVIRVMGNIWYFEAKCCIFEAFFAATDNHTWLPHQANIISFPNHNFFSVYVMGYSRQVFGLFIH